MTLCVILLQIFLSNAISFSSAMVLPVLPVISFLQLCLHLLPVSSVLPRITPPNCSYFLSPKYDSFCLSTLESSITGISTTNLAACVCVCAKFDQFLPVRSQFDSNQHVNSVRIATFQSANFGPLLFAFYCPLFFLRKQNKE